MKVRWSKLALEDLDDIGKYIASDNPERATSFIMELLDLGDSLATPGMAEKGTSAKWAKDPNIRELYYGSYAIIYEVLQDIVMIHEVHHSARIFRHFIR
jgi:plasmid stabilization system protein ParE